VRKLQNIPISCSYSFSFLYFSDWCYDLGFDPLINQKLLPPTFPRYTKIKPADEAYVYFDSLLTRLKQICKLTNCTTFISALVCFSCIILYISIECNLVLCTIYFFRNVLLNLVTTVTYVSYQDP